MTKAHTKNVLKTVLYQEICDKYHKKCKNHHKTRTTSPFWAGGYLNNITQLMNRWCQY